MRVIFGLMLVVIFGGCGSKCPQEKAAKSSGKAMTAPVKKVATVAPKVTAPSKDQFNEAGVAKMITELTPTGVCMNLDAARAEKMVALSVTCTQKPYPNKPGHVFMGPETVTPHQGKTPAFFGCFDWHSAVHGHFAMARILRLFPGISVKKQIEKIFDAHFSPESMKKELAFFSSKGQSGFERPYGWGWFFRLYYELSLLKHPRSAAWMRALTPLAELLAKRTISYLNRLSVPLRAGTHGNTAFSLNHIFDYASGMGNKVLLDVVTKKAREFYGSDRACPVAYEPSGEDFISPCLAEAALMSRVLPKEAFVKWFNTFLPKPWSEAFRTMRTPTPVKDLKDPRIGHLIGLSFQRAWAAARLARVLPADSPEAKLYAAIANRHCAEGFSQIDKSGYGGTHWLASFAIYLTTTR
ncbi:DUF2891 domain-containing protein [Myxococcota bacterium]|nr:DUF2891 domain-containing protein [Myxococcota bacterium]MBU1536108.1 DUF2891 domain-containing protein [Myxococcota bacterium]